MNVLVLTNMLPVADHPWYGIFVQEQIDDLRALGIDVSVLFVEGMESRTNYVRAVPRLRDEVRRTRVDLVHAHYGLTGALAVLQRRAPVVTTFHGSDSSGRIPWQRTVSWCVARASTPIFVSRQLAASLGRGDGIVIPAAVDLQVFRPVDPGAARRALGWQNDGPVALLPGSRRDPAKGAELFDEAVERARQALPGLRAVSLEGIARSDVALTMNAVDVTVMTSLSEGSPVTLKESLACSTPVVSVPVGDVEELLDGLPACEVVPRSAQAIADALVRSVAAGRASELREKVLPFGRSETARAVVDVYRSVLAGTS
jgi:glycosyltransferase involved in cell wall biosynthesis